MAEPDVYNPKISNIPFFPPASLCSSVPLTWNAYTTVMLLDPNSKYTHLSPST